LHSLRSGNWREKVEGDHRRRCTHQEEAAAILALLSANAIVTELTIEVRSVATHPEVDAVLATTLSGQAAILCTRDNSFL
jgi:hypothetical protein